MGKKFKTIFVEILLFWKNKTNKAAYIPMCESDKGGKQCTENTGMSCRWTTTWKTKEIIVYQLRYEGIKADELWRWQFGLTALGSCLMASILISRTGPSDSTTCELDSWPIAINHWSKDVHHIGMYHYI